MARPVRHILFNGLLCAAFALPKAKKMGMHVDSLSKPSPTDPIGPSPPAFSIDMSRIAGRSIQTIVLERCAMPCNAMPCHAPVGALAKGVPL